MNLQVASFLLWNRGQVTLCFVLHLSNASALWRPTFVWTTAEGVREKLALLGAELVDAWEEATCHVVDCFNEPGQRVTWASKLNGHLIITKRLSKGPWIEKLG